MSCRSSAATPSNQTTSLEQAAPGVLHARETRAVTQTIACIDLNTAPLKELISLKGIGEVMANRVIEYRERHGPFQRPEEIIILDGFSERKYKAIADSICVK